MGSLQVTLVGETALRARALLDRYDRLRRRFGLLLVDVTPTADAIHLHFRDAPDRLDLTATRAGRAAWIIGELARLEKAAEVKLAESIHDQELRMVADPPAVIVGPCLFVPSGDRTAFTTLATRCHGREFPESTSLSSFQELGVLLAQDHPKLATLLTPDQTTEQRIRTLRELARSRMIERAFGLAVRHSRAALELRPQDAGLAELAAEAALRARDVEGYELVEPVLLHRGTGRARTCFLLSRAESARGQHGPALEWADRATALASDVVEYWRQVTVVAQRAGRRERMAEGLRQLALLGDEKALRDYRRIRGPAFSYEVLDAWSGPMTAAVFRWKIEQLHDEERLRDLLLLFGDNRELWPSLDGKHLDCVIEAANRVPGKLLALRRQLGRELDGSEAPLPVAAAYAQTCASDGLWDRVLAIHRRHPGAVPRHQVLRGLLELEDYEQVIRCAQTSDPHEALFACTALLRQALLAHAEAPDEWLRELVARCLAGGLSDEVAKEQQHLRRCAPTQPITRQLDRILGQGA